MDYRQQLALIIINDFLHIFKKDSIKGLRELPKIEKILFEKNKIQLESIIEKHIDKLRQTYKSKEISLYDRKRLKNYPYTLFKKLYELNGIKLKIEQQNKLLDKNVQGIMSFCFVV